MDNFQSVYWATFAPHAIKRFNIIDGSPVNTDFLNAQMQLGSYSKLVLDLFLTTSEQATLSRAVRTMPSTVHLFQVLSRQETRHPNNTLHQEVWILGLLKTAEKSLLVPLRRTSDFSTDILASIKAYKMSGDTKDVK